MLAHTHLIPDPLATLATTVIGVIEKIYRPGDLDQNISSHILMQYDIKAEPVLKGWRIPSFYTPELT